MKFFSTILLTVLLAGAATAQVSTTYVLTLEAARKIAADARKYATDNKAPGCSIAITDAGGHLIYLERLDNTFASSAMVAYKKAETAALFRKNTNAFEKSINDGREALITVGYTMLQGGVPVVYNGQVIGAIGVSGSASAQQDEDIALAGSKAKID